MADKAVNHQSAFAIGTLVSFFPQPSGKPVAHSRKQHRNQMRTAKQKDTDINKYHPATIFKASYSPNATLAKAAAKVYTNTKSRVKSRDGIQITVKSINEGPS
jgi:hypothetical protein